MSLFHRAFLYVTRKRTKTLILFLILLVVATLVLSGIAIKDATKTAQLNVRQSLGGMFTIDQNTSDPSKWVSQQVGGFGTRSYYGGAPLTTELADKIMENVPGILGYNATYGSSTAILSKVTGEALELVETDDEKSWIDSLIAAYGDMGQTVSAIGSTNTAFDSYFANGYLKLTDGRHLLADDGNVAIISRELAEKNGLIVGDELILSKSSFKANMLGIDTDSTKIKVKIIGLFQPTGKSETILSNWSMDNSIYTTFPVIRHVNPDIADESYEHIHFYVDDPAELDSIIDRIESLPDFSTLDFVIHVDTSSVDSVMKPLTNMEKLITFLIVLIILIGAAILYLVMSSRIKDRIHESGILLSIGVGKGKILSQYFIEIAFIAVIAFCISFISSSFIAQTIGNGLIDYALTDASTDSDSEGLYNKDGVFISNSDTFKPRFENQGNLTKIDVSVEVITAMVVSLVGFVIIGVSVVLAGLPVLRLSPREILSRMS